MSATENQTKAIESTNHKLLVSAGAGSGKTLVLSSRVARLVESGVPIENIVVLTFTKAAAAEMKQRIKNKLAESTNEQARLQAENIEVAPITTLHGYASRVLKQYFYEVGIDPAFSVLDESAALSLKIEAIESVMRNLTQNRDDKFFDLVDVLFQNRKDDNFKKSIFSIHDFLCSLPNPNEFIKTSKELYTSGGKSAISFMTREVAERANFFLRRLYLLMDECKKEDLKKLVAVLSELELNLVRVKSDNSVAQMQKAAQEYFAPSKIMRGDNPEIAERVADLKTQVKKFFESIGEMFCADAGPEQQDQEMAKAAERINALFDIYDRFDKEYQKLKDEFGALDFSDLERKLFELLKSESGKELKSKIDYLFVDEYQDTNRLQQAIYNEMGAKNYFYVGDVKQSIYGFRLAEPKIFIETRNDFRQNKGEVISLDENFRSHQELIDFTNKLFSLVMTISLGGEDYETEGKMKKGGEEFKRIGADSVFGAYTQANFPRVKIVSIKKAKQAAKDESALPLYSVKNHQNTSDEKMDSAMAEGRALAKILASLASARIYDAKLGKERSIESEDVAVLSATRGEYLKTLLNTAQAEGYSFSPDITQNIFEDCDLSELLNLLKLVSNPKQDVPLFIVLSGFWGKLSSDELAAIKLTDGFSSTNFYKVVEKFKDSNDDKKYVELKQKLINIYEFIDNIRFLSQSTTVSQLIQYIVDSTDFDLYLLGKENGDQKLLLLDSLKEQLANLKCNNSLDEFLWQCENVGFSAAEPVSASRGTAIYDDDGNPIKSFQNITVTTIHKSKGLEYPVVILVGAGRQFNRDDLSKDILLSRAFGVGISSFDTFERVKSSNIIKNALKLDLQKQSLEEDIRLLYVAVTRAINNLIVIGIGDPTEQSTIEKNILSSSCFFDLISKLFANKFPPLYISVAKESFEKLSNENSAKPQNVFALPSSEKLVDEFANAFSAKYAHHESTQIGKKYSVSELAANDQIVEASSLAAESSSDKGNAYHHIMQFIDYKISTADEFQKEKLRLISEGFVSEKEFELVDEEKILKCLNSPLFLVIKKGKRKIMREQQFLMRASAKEIGVSKNCDDFCLLQGVFDLCVENGDGVLIVDYKTGGAESEQKLKEKHKTQMQLYKMAAEKAFKKPASVAIYSFQMDKLIRMDNI